jgi:hypothetical protein
MDPCQRGTHTALVKQKSNTQYTSIAMKTLLALLVLATALPASVQAGSCAPYVTHTCVVNTRTECRWATDHCGRRYSYEVKMVTCRSYYNNGKTSTFTKAYRA